MSNGIDKVEEKIQTPCSQLKILVYGESIFKRLKFPGRKFQPTTDEQVLFPGNIKTVIGIDQVVIRTHNDITQPFSVVVLGPSILSLKLNGTKMKACIFFAG